MHVDDMLIKSKSLDGHLTDLEENFMVMQNNKIRVNPEKNSFGITFGKFLGFLWIENGIKVNLAKCKAIFEMRNPTTIKKA